MNNLFGVCCCLMEVVFSVMEKHTVSEFLAVAVTWIYFMHWLPTIGTPAKTLTTISWELSKAPLSQPFAVKYGLYSFAQMSYVAGFLFDFIFNQHKCAFRVQYPFLKTFLLLGCRHSGAWGDEAGPTPLFVVLTAQGLTRTQFKSDLGPLKDLPAFACWVSDMLVSLCLLGWLVYEVGVDLLPTQNERRNWENIRLTRPIKAENPEDWNSRMCWDVLSCSSQWSD